MITIDYDRLNHYANMKFEIPGGTIRMSDAREIAYLFELNKRGIPTTAENLVDKVYRNPKVFISDFPMRSEREGHIEVVKEGLEKFVEKGILTKHKTGKIFKKVTYLPTEKTIEALKLNDTGYRNWLILANRFKDEYTPEKMAEMGTSLELISVEA